MENGKTLTNPKIANKFNKFYTTVASKLVDKLGKPNNKYKDYLNNPYEHKIFLNEIDPGEVLEILLKLDPTKAADIFGISPGIPNS